MTEMLRKEQSRSFGKIVGDYERGRPSYPKGAVRWLIEDARRVVGPGGGTGKFTAALVSPDRVVVALEESMVKPLSDARSIGSTRSGRFRTSRGY